MYGNGRAKQFTYINILRCQSAELSYDSTCLSDAHLVPLISRGSISPHFCQQRHPLVLPAYACTPFAAIIGTPALPALAPLFCISSGICSPRYLKIHCAKTGCLLRNTKTNDPSTNDTVWEKPKIPVIVAIQIPALRQSACIRNTETNETVWEKPEVPVIVAVQR